MPGKLKAQINLMIITWILFFHSADSLVIIQVFLSNCSGSDLATTETDLCENYYSHTI